MSPFCFPIDPLHLADILGSISKTCIGTGLSVAGELNSSITPGSEGGGSWGAAKGSIFRSFHG